MHAIIHAPPPSRPSAAATARPFRRPHFDCLDQDAALKLVVYVPGVEATGVEISAQGGELAVTARKPQHVRVNWQALHLETAQHDYQLRLRLGRGFDYGALRASLREGVLTIELPKKPAATPHRPDLLARLAPPRPHSRVA